MLVSLPQWRLLIGSLEDARSPELLSSSARIAAFSHFMQISINRTGGSIIEAITHYIPYDWVSSSVRPALRYAKPEKLQDRPSNGFDSAPHGWTHDFKEEPSRCHFAQLSLCFEDNISEVRQKMFATATHTLCQPLNWSVHARFCDKCHVKTIESDPPLLHQWSLRTPCTGIGLSHYQSVFSLSWHERHSPHVIGRDYSLVRECKFSTVGTFKVYLGK